MSLRKCDQPLLDQSTLLRENKKYTEWEFSNADDLNGLSHAVLADIHRYLLPFADRYCQLNELQKTLESPDPKVSIGIGVSVDNRVLILAAIKLIEGDRTGALKILDDALLERATAFPKRRFELEHLRRRVSSS